MALTISTTLGSTDLQALREELDRDRRALDERERALNLVEQMERERRERSQQNIPSISTYYATPVAAIPEGFTDAVRVAVKTVGQKEFSAQDVEGYLDLLGYELPADPRSRISMVLKKLREEKTIELISEGTGREPHRYKLAKK